MSPLHPFPVELRWDASGGGTSDYTSYSRAYQWTAAGKPALRGSADARFRGDPALPNPEDLFVAALAACHMLTFLALCARKGVVVTGYADSAEGLLGARMERVVLRPRVLLEGSVAQGLVERLHEEAHQQCFLARSVSCEVVIAPAPWGAA
jgi:organic hydroperoxide reductase OsmC/OhrA